MHWPPWTLASSTPTAGKAHCNSVGLLYSLEETIIKGFQPGF